MLALNFKLKIVNLNMNSKEGANQHQEGNKALTVDYMKNKTNSEVNL